MNLPTQPYAAGDDDLLRVGEAAALAQCSIDTLRRWERSGHITATRTPTGQRRFRRGDVLAMIAGESNV